ncbi:YidH family protein, partial [Parafrankia sp. FMc2]|uniref:YidH family protein n=1 Tax=Parafrankia sp. FMc2 TaxID=3233196 RepID=UPI0034D6AC78
GADVYKRQPQDPAAPAPAGGPSNAGGAAAGSRARDHLANERTFLAWLRTSVNVMALGLAFAAFDDVTTAPSLAAGAILALLGGAGLWYATGRYRRVNREIDEGSFTTGTSVAGPTIVSLVIATTILIALLLLVLAAR